MINQPQTNTPGWISQKLASLSNVLLDPTIVLSFDRTGYWRHSRQFGTKDLDVDLTGRVCVVTGANSGIGFATSVALAQRGADVWLVCRNSQRGQEARDRIQSQTGNHRVFVVQLDVSDLAAISAMKWPDALDRVDVLVHNAGVLLKEPEHNKQGLELTLATHLVGPLALTGQLLSRLQQGTEQRLIWVSSGGMYTQRLDVDELSDSSSKFDGVRAYARAKRAMVVLAEFLAVQPALKGIGVYCMHPGWVNTPGVKHSIPTFWRITRSILRTPEQGADTVVWLAVARTIQKSTGYFWFDRQRRQTHLLSKTQETPAERVKLWRCLNEWSGVDETIWNAKRI